MTPEWDKSYAKRNSPDWNLSRAVVLIGAGSLQELTSLDQKQLHYYPPCQMFFL